MKHIIILLSILVFSLWSLGLNQTYAGTGSLKKQVEQMPSGEVLIEKIENFVLIVGEKSKQDNGFRRAINLRIEALQEKYSKKIDIKSQNISIILSYIQDRISHQLGITSSRILERFQKIQIDSTQGKFTSRINKIKGKDYQRIHLKR